MLLVTVTSARSVEEQVPQLGAVEGAVEIIALSRVRLTSLEGAPQQL